MRNPHPARAACRNRLSDRTSRRLRPSAAAENGFVLSAAAARSNKIQNPRSATIPRTMAPSPDPDARIGFVFSIASPLPKNLKNRRIRHAPRSPANGFVFLTALAVSQNPKNPPDPSPSRDPAARPRSRRQNWLRFFNRPRRSPKSQKIPNPSPSPILAPSPGPDARIGFVFSPAPSQPPKPPANSRSAVIERYPAHVDCSPSS
jgi:hypothetical protein